MSMIKVDIEEYVALLKTKHSTKVAELKAAHADCHLYVAYCPADRCEGKLQLGRGGSKSTCDKCKTVWMLVKKTD